MIFYSLDIETTGLDPEKDSILELALIREDTTKRPPIEELPTCHVLFKHARVFGEPVALAMNKETLLAAESLGYRPPAAWDVVEGFIKLHAKDKIIVAGKNVGGFDMRFLPKRIQDLCHYRHIDVASVAIDWSAKRPPSLKDLVEEVPHRAVGDARLNIEVLRRYY